jgi:hypothetical protein
MFASTIDEYVRPKRPISLQTCGGTEMRYVLAMPTLPQAA